MGQPMLQIGSKVRIVSKANVRYEGTFVEIDMDKLQIALCDVHFYGTETRDAEFYIAGQTRVYPFVVFKNTDIKEIVVLENPMEVTRMTSFSSSSGISSINASPFSSAEPIRRPYERDLSFEDQSFYNLRLTNSSNGSNRSNFQRTTQYLWRIPRVVDYVGRSGDPKELPLISNAEFMTFEQDYDFEKYNKLFVDLCGGLIDLSLTASNDSTSSPNTEESQDNDINEEIACNTTVESGNNSDSNKSTKTEESAEEDHEQDEHVEHAVAIIESPPPTTPPPSKGAIPKKVVIYQSPKVTGVQSTAYDKSKSFFDTVSCSSIYRSGNINPNWREHNTETFGVPMICHQRRSPRNFRNSVKLPFVAEVKQKSQYQNGSIIKPSATNNGFNNNRRFNNGAHNMNNYNNNYINNNNYNNNNDANITSQFTIKKVHFKAVFMSKNSSTPTKQEQNIKNLQPEANLATATASNGAQN